MCGKFYLVLMKNIVRITVVMILVLMGVNLQAEQDKNSKQAKGKLVSKAGLKGRRIVSPWFICENDEKSIKQITPMADIVSSISIFGEAGPKFINYCHNRDIEVYRAVTGGGKNFDTPQHRKENIDGYLVMCEQYGFDGIDLDYEHLDPNLVEAYTRFLNEFSQALHKDGRKLAICVGFYPAMYQRGKLEFFYDPSVIGRTCDMVRVMCYDMYYAPGKGDKELMDRGDCQGIGPTGTAPWAREAMQFWLRYVPGEKLIMGLPAYSNDYDMTPNGKGTQVDAPRPNSSVAKVFEKIWLPYEQINMYRYLDDQGHPHVFYASDTKSTVAHLETVDELNVAGISFWYYQAVPDETWTAIRKWLKE